MPDDNSKALAVLRETVGKPRPSGAMAVSSSGVRLLNALRTSGLASWVPSRRLTIEEIIQISAVIICLDVRAQDIAKTTFRMYQKLPGNNKRVVEPNEHPVAMLLDTEPNRHLTWIQFFEMLVMQLGLTQDTFVVKKQTSDGRIEELIPTMPARCTHLAIEPDQDPSGKGFYALEVRRLTPHERIQFSGMPEFFLEDEFIHFMGRTFDGISGYSNLDVGAKAFSLSNELTEFQTRLFGNDGQLRGVFQRPGESGDALSDEAFKHLREQLAELMANFRKENRPIVLEEGMTFQEISMTSEQAEVAKARDSAVVDVARIFRIPPHKIMHLVNVKYENMETLEKSYVQDSLIPDCKRIEATLARSLLTKAERSRYFFMFDRREMLLNDMKMLADVVKIMVQNGAMELDEARALFGWNELGNKSGKVRLIPSTFNLIDSASNEVVIPAGAQPQGDAAAAGDAKPADAKKPKKTIDDDDVVIDFPNIFGGRNA